jgi:hypothetical protein
MVIILIIVFRLWICVRTIEVILLSRSGRLREAMFADRAIRDSQCLGVDSTWPVPLILHRGAGRRG